MGERISECANATPYRLYLFSADTGFTVVTPLARKYRIRPPVGPRCMRKPPIFEPALESSDPEIYEWIYAHIIHQSTQSID